MNSPNNNGGTHPPEKDNSKREKDRRKKREGGEVKHYACLRFSSAYAITWPGRCQQTLYITNWNNISNYKVIFNVCMYDWSSSIRKRKRKWRYVKISYSINLDLLNNISNDTPSPSSLFTCIDNNKKNKYIVHTYSSDTRIYTRVYAMQIWYTLHSPWISWQRWFQQQRWLSCASDWSWVSHNGIPWRSSLHYDWIRGQTQWVSGQHRSS